MKILPISEGRKKLFELRRDAVEDCEEIVLTHRDGNLVLLAQDEWESLKETLAVLRDEETMSALKSAVRARKEGRRPKGKSIERSFPDLVR